MDKTHDCMNYSNVKNLIPNGREKCIPVSDNQANNIIETGTWGKQENELNNILCTQTKFSQTKKGRVHREDKWV